MNIQKGGSWIRSPVFKKNFATAFSFSHVGDLVGLLWGDEKTILPDNKESYVADGQIKMTLEGFEALCKIIEYEKELLIKEGLLPIKKTSKKKKKSK